MIKLTIVLCLVAQTNICKPPQDVPAPLEASRCSAYLKNAVVYAVTQNGIEWFAKIQCEQLGPSDYELWKEARKRK